jgi:hypothetical protein
VAFDFIVKRLACCVADNFGSDFTVTLKQAHNGNLTTSASAFDSALALALVHVARKTADESFINFNFAAHLLKCAHLHCESDSMNHKPRGLLSDAERAMDFIRTDAVLAIDNHPNGSQPIIQAERRIFKYSSDLNAKLAARVRALAMADGVSKSGSIKDHCSSVSSSRRAMLEI